MAPQGFSAQKEAPGRGLNPPAGGSFFRWRSSSARPASAPGSTRTGLGSGIDKDRPDYTVELWRVNSPFRLLQAAA